MSAAAGSSTITPAGGSDSNSGRGGDGGSASDAGARVIDRADVASTMVTMATIDRSMPAAPFHDAVRQFPRDDVVLGMAFPSGRQSRRPTDRRDQGNAGDINPPRGSDRPKAAPNFHRIHASLDRTATAFPACPGCRRRPDRPAPLAGRRSRCWLPHEGPLPAQSTFPRSTL